ITVHLPTIATSPATRPTTRVTPRQPATLLGRLRATQPQLATNLPRCAIRLRIAQRTRLATQANPATPTFATNRLTTRATNPLTTTASSRHTSPTTASALRSKLVHSDGVLPG